MTTPLVVWTGPVAKFQVEGATVPGAKELFLQCRGDIAPDIPYCPAIGDAMAQAGLPDLLSKAQITAASLGDVFWGAFSAGGSLLKRILMTPEYRAASKAVLLSDATFTSWKSPGVPLPMEGFVRYALDVIAGGGDKLFVATASPSPNKTYPTGHASLRATEQEIERRSGRSFEVAERFYRIEPQPTETRQLGNVIFAYYPLSPLGHGHTKIAGQVWQQGLLPWLAGEQPLRPRPPASVDDDGWSWPQWLGLLGGGVAGYTAIRAIRTMIAASGRGTS